MGVQGVLPGILAGDGGCHFAVPSSHGPGEGLREPVEQEWGVWEGIPPGRWPVADVRDDVSGSVLSGVGTGK